jgi:N-sulfoglucosamine sulfohydrolase
MRAGLFKWISAACLCGVILCLNSLHAKQPNLVLIIADDLGVQLGCYGDEQALTPNIDQFAAQGTLFETAWVTAASCSPSRGSIFTGLYPHQNGLVGLSHHGFSLDRPFPNLVSLLRDAGYRTGLIGKFHVEPEDSFQWDYLASMKIHQDLIGERRDVRAMADMAEGFVAANTGAPFFLVMSYYDPHVPFYDQRGGLPAEPLGPDDVSILPFSGYTSPGLRDWVAGYYNCVSRLDTGVGMLMDVLQKHAVDEETVVIFIGDHGPPFARAKLSSYDQGMRIPFIVRGPGVEEGQVSEFPVSTVDLLPTFLDFAGVKALPETPGISLKSYLVGSLSPSNDRALFGSFYAHQSDNIFPMRAVRLDDWLLIENFAAYERPRANVDGCEIWPAPGAVPLAGVDADKLYAAYLAPPQYELFHLSKDPYGMVNLSGEKEYWGKLEELRRELDEWRKRTDDPISLLGETGKSDSRNE